MVLLLASHVVVACVTGVASVGGYWICLIIGLMLSTIITAFYFLNIGILIGSLANTLGSECREITDQLDKNVFEAAKALLLKYRALKELKSFTKMKSNL